MVPKQVFLNTEANDVFLSSIAKDGAEGDLKGLPSPCQSSVKEVCLVPGTGISPLSEAILEALPFGAEHKDNLDSIPSRKAPLFSTNTLVFRKALKSSGLQARVFCLPTPMLLTVLTGACQLSEGLLLHFVGASTTRRSWKMRSEPLRAANEALLLSAGKHGQEALPGEELDLPAWLWLGLCTQRLRAACAKANWVQSPP